jgi:N-acyl amino acid synthase of PEP-CTERM/exosortase system
MNVAPKIVAFDDHDLSLQISRSPEHVGRCQRLRYKVYCVERGWYNEVRISKGHELDAYDNRANHALLTRNDNGEGIGVVRLVLPSGDANFADLPIQEIAPDPLSFIKQPVDMTKIAEVSRFAVTRDHKNAKQLSLDGPSTTERRFSVYTVLLMRAIVVMARQNGIEFLCATMEPSLILHLSRLAVKFSPLGEPKEYHGLRQPCYAKLSQIDEDMRRLRPAIHPMVFGG